MVGLVIVGISSLSEKPDEVLGGGGPCNVLASHPGGEEVNGDTSSHFMLQKPGKAPAGWATWLEYKPFFFSSTYTLYIHNFVTSFWHEPYIRRIGNILAS